MDFADWLQRELERRGMNPNQLAKASGRGANTIQNILKRERSVGPEVARDIAKALGLPQHVVFLAAGLQTETIPDLGSHPIKATIAREIGDEDDPAVLAYILEQIRAARALAGGKSEPGKKDAGVTRLPIAN
jgi:transcriptional regulator with XRE-family HTH domain